MYNAWPITRETRKGWERYKLDGYDRFLMERDMMNERPWLCRRPFQRALNTYRWAEKARWDRHFRDPVE